MTDHQYSDILRSIPVCTGEPNQGRGKSTTGRVYPRVYGGTRLTCYAEILPAGLSPCVRGNHRSGDAGIDIHGSIPVCTGEPLSSPHRQWLPEVYPRVYGGTNETCAPVPLSSGLSPCVRGNQQRPPKVKPRRRSIPVCTGEPARNTRTSGNPKVYPRVYGGTSRDRPK